MFTFFLYVFIFVLFFFTSIFPFLSHPRHSHMMKKKTKARMACASQHADHLWPQGNWGGGTQEGDDRQGEAGRVRDPGRLTAGHCSGSSGTRPRPRGGKMRPALEQTDHGSNLDFLVVRPSKAHI